MKNKKSAPTAATVKSAESIKHVQNTTNPVKSQEVHVLKYPVNAENLLIAYEECTGDTPDETLKNLYSIIVSLVNLAYEHGCREAQEQFVPIQKGGAQV